MRKVLVGLLFFLFVGGVFSEEQRIISRLEIKDNNKVSIAKIVSKIKIRARQPYNENVINEDVKNLYATGFFDDVQVEKKDEDGELVVIFRVKEKAVLKTLVIQGARRISKRKIIELVDIKEGSFVDEYKLKEAVDKIKDSYNKKGLAQAQVTYKIDSFPEKNEAVVYINIEEKDRLKVRKVDITGNKSISARRILKLMKLRKAWLFNRGIFREEVLRDDKKRITDFYKLEGFSDVKVDTEFNFQEKGAAVTVRVDEGTRYYIGKVEINGNQDVSAETILKVTEYKEGDIYSEQVVYEDLSQIRELYMDKGYIFCQIEPRSYYNLETGKIDVTYDIVENEVAYLEKISIRGNARTRDEVIRRELRIYPQDKFDGKKVKKSKERLENLGFFEEIRFGTEPGSKPNWIDLVVDVKEAKTGYLSFGGGYSSINEFIGFIEIRQRNFDYRNFSTFTGGGQDISLSANFGTITEQYQVSFTNPWIFDQPIYFGFDGYKKGHSREEDVGYAYEEDIRGGTLHLGKEFSDYLKGGVGTRFERVKISDVVDEATQSLKDEIGTNDMISGDVNLSYDTRDNIFATLKGIYFLNNFQVTGGPFGGDRDFLKYFSRLSLYLPMVKKSVIECRLRLGAASPFSDTEKIPIYERFFAGGASTIRGYHERKVGPIDDVTEDPIGGESMFVGNLEYTYPLADFIKLASFFDSGNVWSESDDFLSGDLKSSVGLGLRIKTPIGPVSVDYGWPLDTEPGEEGKQGHFHFSISRGF